MSFFGRMRVGVAKDGDRTPDGKFKLGPANAQRKQGDMAFQAAKDHVDSAASCARAGDEQGADFHVGMAQQYAALGCKNHLMGGYVDATKATAKKAELDAEYTKLTKDWSDWNAAHGGGGGGSAKSGARAEYHKNMENFHNKQADESEKSDPITSKYHVLAAAVHRLAGEMHSEGHAGADEMSKNADMQSGKALLPEQRT